MTCALRKTWREHTWVNIKPCPSSIHMYVAGSAWSVVSRGPLFLILGSSRKAIKTRLLLPHRPPTHRGRNIALVFFFEKAGRAHWSKVRFTQTQSWINDPLDAHYLLGECLVCLCRKRGNEHQVAIRGSLLFPALLPIPRALLYSYSSREGSLCFPSRCTCRSTFSIPKSPSGPLLISDVSTPPTVPHLIWPNWMKCFCDGTEYYCGRIPPSFMSVNAPFQGWPQSCKITMLDRHFCGENAVCGK